MRKPAVACALVRPGDAQCTYRPPAERSSRVHHLASFDSGKPPARSGTEIAWPLGDDSDVGAQRQPGRQQSRMHADRLEVATEGLPDGDGPGEQAGRPKFGDRTREGER